MRSQRNYVGEFKSSFMSCEKDAELIIKKLFVDSRPYSDELKRLLLINNKDCIDDRTNQAYLNKISNTSINDMFKEGYIRLCPLIGMRENQEKMNYILISFDNFTQTTNNHFKDCIIEIDILCPLDCWDIGNYRQRPIKIAGYIDGILDNTKLTGIGTLEYYGCNEVELNENLAGYCLMYRAVHGDDDEIPSEEE